MSARQTIELPPIGDYQDVPVIDILIKLGDVVGVDDPLIVLESDKATIEVPSPFAGKIVELLVQVGAKLSQGAQIAVVEVSDGATAAWAASAPLPATERIGAQPPPATLELDTPPKATPKPPASPAMPPPSSTGRAHAPPSVRAFARELGVDLRNVKPTGRKGRIAREDVSNFVKERMAAASGANSGLAGFPPMPTYDFAKYGEIERASLSRIQQISGASMHRNWVNIPHVTNFDEADVTEIEAFRLAINAERREPKVKLTMAALLVKAAAHALIAHPRFNASLDGDGLVLKKYVHIGVAVDTPRGLLVPVVRDCDRKGLLEIGAELAALAEKARDGKLHPSDMEGGCFTISSLGGIGGAGFTSIINAPEVAILGAARAQMRQRWDGKAAFQPRLILPVSLSWDHRVVDGVAAARFLGAIVEILGDFRRAMI